MKHQRILCATALSALSLSLPQIAFSQQILPAKEVNSSKSVAAKPDILFLLVDDLGYADVSWHGGKFKTPNVDSIANSGARLEQFYVQPLCSPTRASLLTGRYPMRYELQVGVVRPWAQYGLPLEERTLPQALRESGYTTAMVGKWH
ncbi:MAG: sulfatase, partial [Proteobacteria bacterium]